MSCLVLSNCVVVLNCKDAAREEYLTIIPRARMSSESMRPKAEWAIDSELIRARGIIVLVKSNYLVKNIENKTSLAR